MRKAAHLLIVLKGIPNDNIRTILTSTPDGGNYGLSSDARTRWQTLHVVSIVPVTLKYVGRDTLQREDAARDTMQTNKDR